MLIISNFSAIMIINSSYFPPFLFWSFPFFRIHVFRKPCSNIKKDTVLDFKYDYQWCYGWLFVWVKKIIQDFDIVKLENYFHESKILRSDWKRQHCTSFPWLITDQMFWPQCKSLCYFSTLHLNYLFVTLYKCQSFQNHV